VLAMADEAEEADGQPEATCKMAMEVLEPYSIEGLLAISTAHVEKATMDRVAAQDFDGLIIRPHDHSALIYVPSDQEEWNDLFAMSEEGSLPADLFACLSAARQRGCCWLLFDAAAAKIEKLSFYDW
jgi:hypothetical protein